MSDDRSKVLEERTKNFSVKVIVLCKKLRNLPIYAPIVDQLIRAATSIGANYAEANGASIKNDFRNKIYICKKECIETKYWLDILKDSGVENLDEIKVLLQEAHELTLIFSKIIGSLNNK